MNSDVASLAILGIIKLVPMMITPKPPDKTRLIDARIKLVEDELASLKQEPQTQPQVIDAEFTVVEDSQDKEDCLPCAKARQKLIGSQDTFAVGCMPCAVSHVDTSWAMLDEAMRFARGNPVGVKDPEALRRIKIAAKEILALEREDWTPEKIRNSPQHEQDMIREMQPKIRKLRQDIQRITTPEEGKPSQYMTEEDRVILLEKAVGQAYDVSHELTQKVMSLSEKPEESKVERPDVGYKLEALKAKGINPDEIIQIAKHVQSGEMSMDDAKTRLREMKQKMQGQEDAE